MQNLTEVELFNGSRLKSVVHDFRNELPHVVEVKLLNHDFIIIYFYFLFFLLVITVLGAFRVPVLLDVLHVLRLPVLKLKLVEVVCAGVLHQGHSVGGGDVELFGIRVLAVGTHLV